jgi:hypothetical protein
MAYDPTTEVGQVRLLISDVGGNSGNDFIFEENEIEAFLSMRGSVMAAAATALRSMAGNMAQVLKVIKFLELETNGAQVAKAMTELAKDLEDSEDNDGEIEIIEMDLDPTVNRQMTLAYWLRTGF